ncbi:MAG: aminotransferase class V-fold PLP-dependent enzyme [Desulfobulbaceae bacterium]|nr:aminotransferase class V-fold PLP-dependent enzyme [Desulfobulbaceae bacterium]HIJ78616.1 aminotransferase class V-fold PLP-dependent enzyme [Deltaproteobacteria bacterium]
MQTIYFDNNATTPIAPEVREAMAPYLDRYFGNPASGHGFGEAAKAGLDEARRQVASLVNCPPGRVIFTSGGTEGNNTAILSAVFADPHKKHIISSQVEHASVKVPLEFLASRGYEVEFLPVDRDGGLDLDRLKSAIRPDTALVSLMGANNETGVLWAIEEIGSICREQGALFHCDAIQLAGKKNIDLAALPVDYLTLAGHKLHGPKGVGALCVQRTAPVSPLVMGSDQEGGRRAGTENVPGIVGFGKACALALDGDEAHGRIQALRDRLEQGILARIPDARVNGAGQPRLVNTINVSFKHVSSAGLIQDLDLQGIAVSAHSACQTGDLDPSHVLRAMQVDESYLHGTLRISLSRYSSEAEVERVLTLLPRLVATARQGFAL